MLTEKGQMPQVHWCPISESTGRWICPPVSYCRGGEGRAEAGAAAVEALCLQAAGGAGGNVLFPNGQALSSSHVGKGDLFSFFPFFSFLPHLL